MNNSVKFKINKYIFYGKNEQIKMYSFTHKSEIKGPYNNLT